MAEFKIKAGSIHERFLASTAKIQIFGGGFANGKTASTCIKVIQVAKDYPGANILIARATYPKLNDTIRPEFFKWLPKDWIRAYSKKDNTVDLINGSTVNFRYVQQQGKERGTTSSNLLSATYDLIAVDQFDDPEFEYKDFTDLLGRLRGHTKYAGSNPRMPRTGPRFLLITLNPTRNWIYRNFIRYVIEYQEKGTIPRPLQEMLDKYKSESLDELIELFQGSTMTNSHNLEEDYLNTLRATYSGTMADRYIEGDWGAFQGLVYPSFNEWTHMVDEQRIELWRTKNNITQFIEAFDHGIRSPICYLLGFTDEKNNVVFVDGFKEKELSPEAAVKKIRDTRKRWQVPADTTQRIYADPSVFRRGPGEYRTVGKSVAEIYADSGRGVTFCRGNNDILSGIIKVRAYLAPHRLHRDPFTGVRPGSFLYFNRDRLPFIEEEMVDYYWEHPDDDDAQQDKPMDRNDHAMDAIKYGLTGVPDIARLIPKKAPPLPFMTNWTEKPDGEREHGKSHRYG